MVRVTNGIETFEIPEGAVKVYSGMGFKVMKTTPLTAAKKPVDKKEKKQDKKSISIEELQEKPISQWNQNEVKEFAAAKGYDVSGAKSLKEAKNIVRKALEEEEKAMVE